MSCRERDCRSFSVCERRFTACNGAVDIGCRARNRTRRWDLAIFVDLPLTNVGEKVVFNSVSDRAWYWRRCWKWSQIETRSRSIQFESILERRTDAEEFMLYHLSLTTWEDVRVVSWCQVFWELSFEIEIVLSVDGVVVRNSACYACIGEYTILADILLSARLILLWKRILVGRTKRFR